MTSSLTPESRIIIVGAGAFGLSTAFHLLQRGYSDVIILDRASILPAVDAASTDINKSTSDTIQNNTEKVTQFSNSREVMLQ